MNKTNPYFLFFVKSTNIENRRTIFFLGHKNRAELAFLRARATREAVDALYVRWYVRYCIYQRT